MVESETQRVGKEEVVEKEIYRWRYFILEQVALNTCSLYNNLS